ncbi:MAG: hypothetical protein ISS27_02215 [Candidatus Omnitrophica bacterium]|nr:hypothetical protein [Candidatus Omnitrophota bacterium]
MLYKCKARSSKRKIKAQSSKSKVKNLKLLVLGLSFALCVLHFTFAYAQAVTGRDLIDNATEYNGKIILFEGEVIGDIMIRGEHAWINVSDGDTAIGIWTEKKLTEGLTHTGGYNSKGDWIRINGIFSRACGEHSGELDIHAQSIKLLNSGGIIQEGLNLGKRNIALVLLGALCLSVILQAYIKISSRRQKV